jgi:hypothetical protein
VETTFHGQDLKTPRKEGFKAFRFEFKELVHFSRDSSFASRRLGGLAVNKSKTSSLLPFLFLI